MCLCVKPYRHNTTRLCDESVPSGNAETEDPKRSPEEPDHMTDNLGLTYVAVRNCDLERFSAK
ncbi:MAG: hypothetical protein ACLQMU_03195 [Methanoregula sp.]|uniref:hypothetical protein n=1 Tax=Methanoregula sp. TaxID=2052170 RepID=UPI003FD7A804